MNLTEREFEDTTPLYFNIRLSGLRRLQYEQEKQEWERARWLARFIAQQYASKPLSLSDVARFSWDEPELSMAEYYRRNKDIYDKLKPN